MRGAAPGVPRGAAGGPPSELLLGLMERWIRFTTMGGDGRGDPPPSPPSRASGDRTRCSWGFFFRTRGLTTGLGLGLTRGLGRRGAALWNPGFPDACRASDAGRPRGGEYWLGSGVASRCARPRSGGEYRVNASGLVPPPAWYGCAFVIWTSGFQSGLQPFS